MTVISVIAIVVGLATLPAFWLLRDEPGTSKLGLYCALGGILCSALSLVLRHGLA